MQRQLTFFNLAANIGIVITGGAVRLTSSGLGCPTWPKCTKDSYHPTGELGIHAVVEYSNRILSVIVGIVAALTVVALWRIAHRRLAVTILGGVVLQGLVGGLTVRFDLSPYFVGPHFLFSMVLIALAYQLWRRTSPPPVDTEPRLRPLTVALTIVSAAVLVVGVVVTGSGPHAGDARAVRTGLDPEMISQLHVDAVFLMVGLTVAYALVARSTRRVALVLLGILLAQGLIGFVQYFTGLPEILVGAHLAGACAVWVATLRLWPATAPAQSPPAAPPEAKTAQTLELTAPR
ncbi:MAG TPA: COX15/CtaA family protein [Candidatus Limnocylindrales bacterium]|nr:COX15/CtaA family protein [Candidatus Limnocylindrales bacterium]